MKGMMGMMGAASLTKLPVSAYELPKLKMAVKKGLVPLPASALSSWIETRTSSTAAMTMELLMVMAVDKIGG